MPRKAANDMGSSSDGRNGEAEWALRVDLAAAYRLAAHFGWDELIFTHFSARLPGPEHHFLINPFGLLYDEVTAINLVNRLVEKGILIELHETAHPKVFYAPEIVNVIHSE